MIRFFHNHLGFETVAPKRFLVGGAEPGTPFRLQSATGAIAVEGRLEPAGTSFRDERLALADVTAAPAGRHYLIVGDHTSAPILVADHLFRDQTLSAVLEYFRNQRCADPWNEADRTCGFFGGRTDRVDVSGGWYDASGDVSKYLSHLSYANFMNPQQTPLVAWALLEHFERRRGEHAPGIAERLLDEARHGADFLCRLHDPAGYFYMTVFDVWSKTIEKREICCYETQRGIKNDRYQAGFRQGGGVTIAALARAARVVDPERIIHGATYLEHARRGFEHLAEHNPKYLDDGRENVIDDYCALLAATELYATTDERPYLDAARERAESLLRRIAEAGPFPGWIRADDAERPYFHAAEAGFPVLSLLRLSEFEPDVGRRASLLEGASRCLSFELAVTGEVENPFGYARQFVQDADGARRTSFFIPHHNETGYWWQGENARLASLATAVGLYLRLAKPAPGEARALRDYAYHQLDWILGCNPFDACMIHGFGRNNLDYLPSWPNITGGICNGITAGLDDENDIDFGRPHLDPSAGDHSWRWGEQWLPHAAWYVAALAEL